MHGLNFIKMHHAKISMRVLTYFISYMKTKTGENVPNQESRAQLEVQKNVKSS